jgi:hypothetical protein
MSEHVVLNTASDDWKVIRTVTGEGKDELTGVTDALPAVATKHAETYRAIAYEVPNWWNGIELTFEVYDAAGNNLITIPYYVYMARDWKSCLRHVCHGVATMVAGGAGPQTEKQGLIDQIHIAPTTLTITTQSWPSTAAVVDGSGTSGDGVTNAGVPSVVFDRCGYRLLIVLIPATITTGAAGDRIVVKASGY